MITREDRQPFHDTCRILDKADDFIYVLSHPGMDIKLYYYISKR